MPARIASLVVLLVALVAVTQPAAADTEPGSSAIPVRYGIERPLVLGMRVEVAPGLLVTRDARGTQLVGYTGTVKLKAYADLVIVKSEVESLSAAVDPSGAALRWSVGVHLGGELQPGKLLGHVASGVRSAFGRVL